MEHREERDFVISVHLSAVFDEDYEGEEDGFAWHQRFEERVRPALVAAVFEILRAQPGARVVSAPRGRHPSDAVDIDVELRPAAG